MNHYRLTFKDKLYFLFQDDYIKRHDYLYKKVKKHESKYYNEKGLRTPYDFETYIISYISNLIFEYENL